MIKLLKGKMPIIDGINKTDQDKLKYEILEFSEFDLTFDGEFCKGYCFLTKDKILLVNYEKDFAKTTYFKGIPEKYIKEDFKNEKFEIKQFSITAKDQLKIVKTICGGIFTVADKSGENEIAICNFSNKYQMNFVKLTHALNAPIDNEGKSSNDADEESCEFCPKCGTRYPDKERKICPKCLDKKSIFCRTLSYFKPYTLKIVLMFICYLVTAALNLLWPYLNGRILYDKILSQNAEFLKVLSLPVGEFALALLLVVLTMVLTKVTIQILGIIQGALTAKIVPNVVNDLKCSVFEAMGKLSLKFFNSRQTGSLMTRILSDAERVTGFFIDDLPYAFIDIFTIVLTAIVMFSINIPLTVISLFSIPILLLISIKMMPVLWHFYGKRHRAERSLNSRINDNLNGARVVKAFGKENNEAEKFDYNNKKVKDSEISLVAFDNKIYALYSVAENIGALIIWGLGSYFVLKSSENFSLGLLITFVGYVSQLNGPLDFMANFFKSLTDSINSAQRMYEIIDAIPEILEKETAITLENVKGSIEIKNMTFGYEPNKQILKNINLFIKEGEILGIVGRSGAGKSTLVSLISRLYDPNEGDIYLDGINLRDLSFKTLRNSVAMVSQETYIFMGSVSENIKYANSNATSAEIIRAAVLSGSHDFICKMPDGYDTIIGSSGRILSGGEKQRISIARAILKKPKILILDEATASVDTETEKNIQKSLDFLIKGRTTISIAHRLSTLKNVNRLVVLENGKICEEGTHNELIEKKGIYYKLRELQTKALALKGEIAD